MDTRHQTADTHRRRRHAHSETASKHCALRLHHFSPRSLEVMASFGFDGDNTAFGAARAEAVQESKSSRVLLPCQALVQRVTFAHAVPPGVPTLPRGPYFKLS